MPPAPEGSAFVVKGWHWVVSILIPFIGVILGIVAIAKNQVGKGIALIAVSLTSWTICFFVGMALIAAGTNAALEEAAAPSAPISAPVEPAEPASEAPAPAEPADELEPVSDMEEPAAAEFTADEMLDMMPEVAELVCSSVELGEMGGVSEADMFEQFRSGYDSTAPATGAPSAREVFEAAMARC
jgi:hypothetical protein